MNNKITFILGAGTTKTFRLPQTLEQKEMFENLDSKECLYLDKLKRIIKGIFQDNYDINDVYNYIDTNLLLQNAIEYEDNRIESYELFHCKKELITNIMKHFMYIIKNNHDTKKYEDYIDFYYKLAENELENKKAKDLTKRENFVSNYSIINFNWDLYSIMPIIEAHNKLNNENRFYFNYDNNPKLKIFTDFNCESASSNDESLWYPYTENISFFENKNNHHCNRRTIVTKVLFPHGLMNMFKCSKCSRHSLALANLTLDSVKEKLLKEEIYSCPYCGNKIKPKDVDILIQSNLKERNSYFQELRLRLMSELNQTKTLFILGYSMPNDDIDYQILFKSLINVKNVFVVLKDENGINKFLKTEELDEKVISNNKEVIDRYIKVFKGKELYFNFIGITDAFNKIIEKYKECYNK